MASKSRKFSKSKKADSPIIEKETKINLPETLSVSDVEFSKLTEKRLKCKWQNLLNESNLKREEIEEYRDNKKGIKFPDLFLDKASHYIEFNVFNQLLPALSRTLGKSIKWNTSENPKCFFSGIDDLAQELWNNNPRYPERKQDNLHIFNMDWVREHLKKHPRPYYPKSWLWPEEYAATVIQKTVRQYFVQRTDEVQELRDFWRKLQTEKLHPEILLNPFLMKTLALKGYKRVSITFDSNCTSMCRITGQHTGCNKDTDHKDKDTKQLHT